MAIGVLCGVVPFIFRKKPSTLKGPKKVSKEINSPRPEGRVAVRVWGLANPCSPRSSPF
ncbi:hypothetical protein RND71_039083 [Anisodus tanguticus]|uniref:Uncharacterized protein n=1 Tax=Anisodus tanguticus TaxID=243964 RepID=A0AAE1URP9_9SOLA|nr:hypothetical protein RND71_039083 [Anisodus tanguticus]